MSRLMDGFTMKCYINLHFTYLLTYLMHAVEGLMIAAELVSCLKRTLARMLFIVVSLGFGIVRSGQLSAFFARGLFLYGRPME